MSASPPPESAAVSQTSQELAGLSPWRCWLGTGVAGGMAAVMYILTLTIAQSFAQHTPGGNALSLQLAVTVRTAVIGIAALGTGVFALIALGLFFLGVKVALPAKSSPSN